MPDPDDERKRLLSEVLAELVSTGKAVPVQTFRVAHEGARAVIDGLVKDDLVAISWSRYVPTIEGLRALGDEASKADLHSAADVLVALQAAYRKNPGQDCAAATVSADTGLPEPAVKRALTLLSRLRVWTTMLWNQETGLVDAVRPSEEILDVSPSDVAPDSADEPVAPAPASAPAPLLARIEIRGYRPFRDFVAEPGDLTVILGANASGKSSLFDFLRFVSRAVQQPLAPEIDERAAGRRLFHAGGAERFAFALDLNLGGRVPLRYEAEIAGPIGSPRVTRERLATTHPPDPAADQPFTFLDFAGGRGAVRDPRQRKLARPAWTVPPNELALRRALDPTLVTLSKVQAALAGMRFYSGFSVEHDAPIRRPVPTEPEPELQGDGSNLSAVLMWIHHEHPDVWEEIEGQLRSAVPGFGGLNVKPRGGPGTVLGTWTERGVEGELTLADLSDGTLRLLCWAVLCLSPRLPPVICIDEPEIGLHPRVLPILAGLLQMASGRAQILVATHSPYLLSQFRLEDIAVMRKEDGAARFVRPHTSSALRAAVEEMGGEGIARLHVSDELETLP